MSDSQATLTLTLKAKNLAGSAVQSIQDDLEKVAVKAKGVAGRVSESAKKMGNAFANAIGNAVENLVQGGDLGPTLALAGAYMAGQLAEEFGGKIIERIGSSSLVGAITPAFTALGTAIGGIIDTGIGIGMVALPAVLVGAIIGAIIYLIANPQVMVQISELGQKLMQEMARTIIKGAGVLADALARALASINIDVGAFHIHGGTFSMDMPDLTASVASLVPGIPKGHAAGGWVGLHGPEMGIVGEKGPEYISPAGSGPAQGGVMLQGVSQKDIVRMVDEGLYFRLRRAGTAR